MAYLSGAAFDFYFDRFTFGNAPTEGAKEYEVVKVMLERFSIQKTDSEISRDPLSLRYDGGDISIFLSRAGKVYNQEKVGNNMKFELLVDSLKPDLMFF